MRLKVSESQIQSAYFDWIRIMEVQDERFKNIFAIPNGGLRHIRVAQKLKREGVRPGVFDVAIMVPQWDAIGVDINFSGAFIEFKAGKNKMTKEQSDFLDRITMQGYAWAICYSTEGAIQFTKEYLRIK